MKQHYYYVAGAMGLLALGLVFAPRRQAPVTQQQVARKESLKADGVYGTPQAQKSYEDFVSKWQASPDKNIQDEVGEARMHLAYMAAKKKDFTKARQMFLQTASSYKGTGAAGSDFGGIPDQAAYQAAVCLSADGKKDEARTAFVGFMKQYELSPLVHAARRRLNMLGGEAYKGEYDALLNQAIAAQEKHIRFELSVCGPKALAYVLSKLGKGDLDYKQLAKECKTNNDGSSMEDLKLVLRNHGVSAYGYVLNRSDLVRLSPGSILSVANHYIVFDHVAEPFLYAYDPTTNSVQKQLLPKKGDSQFSLPVLSLTQLDLNSN